MPKLLFIKSIFAPNKQMFDITTNSIIKLNIFKKLSNQSNKTTNTINEDNLLLIGWTNKKFIKYFKLFIRLHKLNFSNIYTEFWQLNYGKYYLMNRIIDYIKKSDIAYDMIVYLDHDIHIGFSSLKKFYNTINFLSNNTLNNIGLIAFNHKGDIRHQQSINENSIVIDNIKLLYPTEKNLGAIACGGYIIRADIIKQLDNFELISVYGLDDWHLVKKINDRGYDCYVMADCYLMHPVFKLDYYDKWKRDMIMRLIANNANNPNNINYYYQTVEGSINMWN